MIKDELRFRRKYLEKEFLEFKMFYLLYDNLICVKICLFEIDGKFLKFINWVINK